MALKAADFESHAVKSDDFVAHMPKGWGKAESRDGHSGTGRKTAKRPFRPLYLNFLPHWTAAFLLFSLGLDGLASVLHDVV